MDIILYSSVISLIFCILAPFILCYTEALEDKQNDKNFTFTIGDLFNGYYCIISANADMYSFLLFISIMPIAGLIIWIVFIMYFIYDVKKVFFKKTIHLIKPFIKIVILPFYTIFKYIKCFINIVIHAIANIKIIY